MPTPPRRIRDDAKIRDASTHCCVGANRARPRREPPRNPTALRSRSPTLPDVFAHELRLREFIAIHRVLSSRLADPHASVLASFTIGSYVPPRGKLFIMHNDAHNVLNGSLRPDFVVFDLRQSQPYFSEEAVRYFFAYLQASPEYYMVADVNKVVIFAKR